MLTTDYGARVPLWSDDGMLERTEIIPKVILKQLRAWARFFDEHYDEDEGWPNLQMCRNQYVEGLRLFAELRQQLGSKAILS